MDTNQILFLSFLFYLIVQMYTLKKFTSVLKKLSLLSAIIMAVVLVVTVYSFLRNSDLWPLWLLFTSPLALAYQFVLLILFLIMEQNKEGI